VLRQHGKPPGAGQLAGPCRRPRGGHLPDAPFGTVSATVAQWDAQRRLDYRYAPGPPCLTPWERVTAPLIEAGIAPG
jgi:hypothetical protein